MFKSRDSVDREPAVSIVLGLVALLALWACATNLVAGVDLRMHVVRTTATVTAVIDGGKVTEYDLTFTDESGKTRSVSGSDNIERAGVGDKIEIYYNPGFPWYWQHEVADVRSGPPGASQLLGGAVAGVATVIIVGIALYRIRRYIRFRREPATLV